MIRNLKIMGSTLAAVFALSAALASAASAQNGLLTSTGPWTGILTQIAGQPLDILGFGKKWECPSAIGTVHKFNQTPHAFVPSGASTVTVTPHYEPGTQTEKNCKSTDGFFVTITVNGCDYVLHLGATTGTGKTYGVTGDIVCPVGKTIEVHFYTSNTEAIPVCTYTIPGQNNRTGLHITDDGTGSPTVNGTLTPLKMIRHAGLCGGAAEEEGGAMAVNMSAAGKNEAGSATAVSVSHL